MYCRLEHNICTNCGWVYSGNSQKVIQRICFKKGLGDYLHELLINKLGADFENGCACKEWLLRMNEWGPGGCRENLKKIVGGLLAEAKRRQWVLDGHPILSKVAAIGTELPGGMIFARAWARKIVLEAITRSERNASENARTGSDCQG